MADQQALDVEIEERAAVSEEEEEEEEPIEEILDRAAKEGDKDVYRRVLNIKDYNNIHFGPDIALQLCVRFQRRRIFDYLIMQPDINIDRKTTTYGDTPLVWALNKYCTYARSLMTSDYEHFLTSLLKKGANVNVKDSQTWTPLYLTCNYGNDECIHMLLWYEADPRIPMEDGFVPFDVATRRCSESTLEILFDHTFDELDDVTLNLYTLMGLIKRNFIAVFEKVLERVSAVDIESTGYVTDLIKELHNLPFPLFQKMVEKFSNLFEFIKMLDVLNVQALVSKNPDAVQYVTFFAEHCQELDNFHGTPLVNIPEISADELSKLLFLVLTNGVKLTLDLDQLYARFGFLPLFENLLFMDFSNVKEDNGPSFVPVWYNTTLASRSPVYFQKTFLDQDLYFEQAEVPSLLQLSRDVFRQKLIEDNDIQDPAEFLRLFKQNEMCDDFKDILIFKRQTYSKYLIKHSHK